MAVMKQLCADCIVRMIHFIRDNRQYHLFEWYWNAGYFHAHTPNHYILGYRNGTNDYSWSCGPEIPVDVRLTRKQLTDDYGYKDEEGKSTLAACDYYIVRRFGRDCVL